MSALRPLHAEDLSGRRLTLVVACIAQLMVVIDLTIVNVSMPAIERSFSMTESSLQWVVNCYAITCGGFLLFGGRASDIFGRRRILLLGMTVFTGASVMNALAAGPVVLIAGRAMQGIGAALISPAALAIVATTFTEARERARAITALTAVGAAGGGLGLVLGGLLTQELSWRYVFWINVPVDVAAALLALRAIPATPPRPGRTDLPGAAAVTAGLLALSYAIVKTQTYGWASFRTASLMAGAFVLLVAFFAVERRSPAPLVPFSIFRRASIAAANAAVFLVSAGFFSMFYFIGLYLQVVKGLGPLETGAGFLPFTFIAIAGARPTAKLIDHFGADVVASVGLTLGGAGLFGFSWLPVGGSYALHFFAALLVLAVGMSAALPALTVLGTSGIDAAEAGLASGILNTSRQIGAAVGLAALVTIASSHTDAALRHHVPRAEALTSGFRVAFLVAAGVMLAVPALLRRFGRRRVADDALGGAAPARSD